MKENTLPTPHQFPIPDDAEYLHLLHIEKDLFGPRCLLQSSWQGVEDHGTKLDRSPLHYDKRVLPAYRPKKKDTFFGRKKKSDYKVEMKGGQFVWTPKESLVKTA